MADTVIYQKRNDEKVKIFDSKEYAKVDGNYSNMVVGNAEQLISADYTINNTPYTFRTAGGGVDIGDREYDELVGGTIAWNQLLRNGNFANDNYWVGRYCSVSIANNIATLTPTSEGTARGLYSQVIVAVITGHKYLLSGYIKSPISSSVSISLNGATAGAPKASVSADVWTNVAGIYDNVQTLTSSAIYFLVGSTLTTSQSIQYKNIQVFDLTAMFGTAIADYIYALEQANTGAGVAWFTKLFPKSYYAYDTGTLMSVQATSHDMVGFNQWDEQWEQGGIASTNGQNASSSSAFRSKNYIPVFADKEYYFKSPAAIYLFFYDINKNYLGYAANSKQNITYSPATIYPSAAYIRFRCDAGTTYTPGTVCINLSWSGYRNGEYEPYEKHSYPLDSTLTLRGISTLDASNNLVYDGDIYASDGTVTRRYASVDLGTLTWTYNDGSGTSWEPRMQTPGLGSSAKRPSINTEKAKMITSLYCTESDHTVGRDANADKTIALSPGGTLYVRDSAYTDAATFKTAMSGVMLVYELAISTTETADAFQSPQIVSDFGTEEYVDAGVTAGTRDVAIPVGHETKYIQNLRDKLRRLPNMPDAEGDYLVRYTDRMSSLIPLLEAIPAAASDNTPEDLGEASAGTSDYYSRADHVHQLPSQIATNTAHIEQVEGKADKANKNIENIRALMNGVMYQDDVDATSAYVKSVPSGAMQWASMDTVGGKSLVWNQRQNLANWFASRGTFAVADDDVITYTATTAGDTKTANRLEGRRFVGILGHKVYVSADIKASLERKHMIFVANTADTSQLSSEAIIETPENISANTWHTLKGVVTISERRSTDNTVGLRIPLENVSSSVLEDATMQLKNVMCFDLTAMFGEGNEPTAEQFEAMFPADYYAYSAPTLLSMGVTEVVSKDSSAVTVGTISIPAEVKALTGYGWSARNVYNYIDFENKKFVQRVGSIDLGSVPYQTATVNGKAGFRTTVSTCIPDIKVPESSSDVLNMMSVPFYSEAYTTVFNRDRDNCCCVTNSDSLFLYASSLSALTASEFKTAMSGVYLYYELAEPVITDISEYLTDDHLIEVEAGGTLVFPNQHGDTFRVPVPSQETYMIDIQEAVSNG